MSGQRRRHGYQMIKIPFDPNIISTGSFTLSWHGFLSFVAVSVAVYLVARWAKRDGINQDFVYNTAVFAIAGGIVGARIVHVADNWHIYRHDFGQVFALWEGGIGLWGAILGGSLTGVIYAFFAKYPVGKLLDLSAPALLIAQSIGRIGDIINGEHWSRATSLPWGWVFTHPESPGRVGAARIYGDPDQAVHPAVVYEMIWNGIAFGIIWKLRNRLKPAGSIWAVYLALYAVGRFAIQYLRFDPVKFWGFQEAHLIAIMVFVASVGYIAWKVRFKSEDEIPTTPEEPKGRVDRRERRSKARAKA